MEYSQSYYATLQGENEYSFLLSDYGIAPFPWGPKSEYGVTCSSFVISDRRFICALSGTSNDKDEFGYILDYMFDPLTGDGEEAWKENLRYIFHYEEDVATFKWLYDNVGYNYAQELSDISSDLERSFSKIISGSEAVSTALSSLSDAANASLEKYYEG